MYHFTDKLKRFEGDVSVIGSGFIMPMSEFQQYEEAEDGNLVSSKRGLSNLIHMPAIDLDVECELVPSKTKGHYHLYINRTITWEKYRTLLAVLVDCGLIQEGFFRAAMARGATFLAKDVLEKHLESKKNL